MANRNWRVDAYIASGTDLQLIADDMTEEKAIALTDRLSRLYGIECIYSETLSDDEAADARADYAEGRFNDLH